MTRSPSDAAPGKPEIGALLDTIIYATILRDEFRDRLLALLHAAVEQERRRCEGVAREVGATMPPWPTSTQIAAEIATRIAGERETK